MRTLSSLQDNGFPGKNFTRQRRTWPWVSLAAAALLVGGWSVNSLLSSSVVYYLTPSEVQAASVSGVRLAGSLVAGSVTSAGGTTTFRVTDGRVSVPVRYDGPPSSALSTGSRPGSQVVAEGSMGDDGVFHAEQLMAKCPSKFTAGG